MDTKLIAIYFPQFHNIPENDLWWGTDFTDWKLVKQAKPLFKGHYQPRIPIDGNYYNPCNKETLAKQISLAQQYGVYGFMFYHYWFDGKLILEKPLNVFLENKELNFPFCLSWANLTWTRQWKGNNEVLLAQNHIPDETLWKKHFEYLLPFFKDSRAIKIDDKPVFSIYVPDIVKETEKMFTYWNKLAIENGLNGIYFIATKGYDFPKDNFLSNYNAVIKFQPREANTSKRNTNRQGVLKLSKLMRLLPEKYQNKLVHLRIKFKSKTLIDSYNIWENIIKYAFIDDFKQNKLTIFESAFFDWDNTPRYRKRATIYTELSLNQKELFLKKLYDKAVKNKSEYIFFNAWNEWSESAYLEPDVKNKYEHLEIVKKVFKG